MKPRSPLAALASLGVVGALALALAPAAAVAQTDPAARARNRPAEPYRIAGNLYSVGASDVMSLLFVTPAGDILLDGGFAETAPMIRDNLRKLGFRLEDVKILLNSHAHFDRAGGLAQLKAWSGGTLWAGEKDAAQLERGGLGDFAFGDQHPFPPVHVDHPLRDGDTVSLGGTVLTAHLTPGHTPGCLTWSATIEENGKPLRFVFAGSTTINPSVHLVDRPGYPGIAADYRRTFAVLKGLPCDLCLAPHASATPDPTGKARQSVDPAAYRDYLAAGEEALRSQLEDEGKRGKP